MQKKHSLQDSHRPLGVCVPTVGSLSSSLFPECEINSRPCSRCFCDGSHSYCNDTGLLYCSLGDWLLVLDRHYVTTSNWCIYLQHGNSNKKDVKRDCIIVNVHVQSRKCGRVNVARNIKTKVKYRFVKILL